MKAKVMVFRIHTIWGDFYQEVLPRKWHLNGKSFAKKCEEVAISNLQSIHNYIEAIDVISVERAYGLE